MHVNVPGVKVPALQERAVAADIVYPVWQPGVHESECAIVAPSPHADEPETVGAVQPASFHIKMESSTAHFTNFCQARPKRNLIRPRVSTHKLQQICTKLSLIHYLVFLDWSCRAKNNDQGSMGLRG